MSIAWRSHFEIPSLLSLVSIEGNWLLPLTFGTNPIFNPDDLVMTVYTTHLVFLLGRDPSLAPLSFSFGLRSQKMLRKGQGRLGKCCLSWSIPNVKSIILENWPTWKIIKLVNFPKLSILIKLINDLQFFIFQVGQNDDLEKWF